MATIPPPFDLYSRVYRVGTADAHRPRAYVLGTLFTFVLTMFVAILVAIPLSLLSMILSLLWVTDKALGRASRPIVGYRALAIWESK